MKPYLLFAGANYYPGGGWNDFEDSFSTLDEAKAALEEFHDWGQIVFEGRVVAELEGYRSDPRSGWVDIPPPE